MKKATLIFLLFIASLHEIVAQDPQFTQFYSVPLFLAPSFAGATKQHRIGTAYRNQWTGIPGGYVTYMGAYDYYMSKFRSGFGISYMRDYAGTGKLGSSRLALAYSYDVQLSRTENAFHFRPGVSFEFFLYGVDFTRLIFSDQITAAGSSPNSIEDSPGGANRGNYDASASMLLYNPKMWYGVTFNHLFMPNVGFYNEKTYLPIKFSFFGGMQISKKSHLLKPLDESVSVAYIYRRQGDFQQLDAGLYWYKVPIVFGAWYRGIPIVNSDRGDAIAFLVGYKNRYFSVGYSYDFTISNLVITSQGSHEISLNYHFQTTRKKKYHAIPCPEF